MINFLDKQLLQAECQPNVTVEEAHGLAWSVWFFGFLVSAGCIIFFRFIGQRTHADPPLKDIQVLDYVRAHRNGVFDRLMPSISNLVWGPGVMVLVGTLAAMWHRQRRRADALALVLLVFGGFLLNSLLKLGYKRQRPFDYLHLIRKPADYSFPSGHAMVGFITYVGLGHFISRRSSLPLRLSTMAGSLIVSTAIGFSRVYMGVHFPSDVIAGMAVGLMWVIMVLLGTHRFRVASRLNHLH